MGRGNELGAGQRPGVAHVPRGAQQGVWVSPGALVGTGSDRGTGRWCAGRTGIRNARGIRGVDILGSTSRSISL